MAKENKGLFNKIAPAYGLFYDMQKKSYAKIIAEARSQFDLLDFKSIIDVGCGTGALSSVLEDLGMDVTGIDPAEKMLKVARSKNHNKDITFIKANVLEGLDFPDKSLDIAISSYVAHGLKQDQRKTMYKEMSRISKEYVIIHDYNKKRSFFTSLVEWLEGGDYFHFIKNIEPELNDCLDDLKKCFIAVRVVNVGVRANWYICTPHNSEKIFPGK